MNILNIEARCGHVAGLAKALYAKWPELKDQAQIVSTAGRVRINTRLQGLDVPALTVAIQEYALAYAEQQSATHRAPSQRELRTMAARRQRNAQQQAQRLHI